MNSTKKCTKCGEIKPFNEFNNHIRLKYGKRSMCRECEKEHNKKYYRENPEKMRERSRKYRQTHVDEIRKIKGVTPMDKNRQCPQYLGIFVGERLCKHLFNDVEVMPFGNSNFDIICNKGKKIDVKTSCFSFSKNREKPHWQFRINKNKIADYFICVAFDNRTDLNPLHMWMIPSYILSNKMKTTISTSTIHKWDEWKRDISDAQLCCTTMKNDG